MTLSVRHGRRILNKPFNTALHKWHLISAPLLPTAQMCAITTALLVCLSSCLTSSTATTTDTKPPGHTPGHTLPHMTGSGQPPDHHPTSSADNWPLKYHYSQWLHKEFITSEMSDSMCEPNRRTDIKQCHISDNADDHNIRHMSEINSLLRNVSAINELLNGSSLPTLPKTVNTVNSGVTTESVPLPATTGSDTRTGISSVPNIKDSLIVSNNQCLFLDRKSAKSICDSSQGSVRLSLMNRFHLKNCDRYSLQSVLRFETWQSLLHSSDTEQCQHILQELVMIDNTVDRLICQYDSLLERYDCQNGFSVIWTCDDCRKVYREWVCSMIIPFHINGGLIKPCRSFCERVEQRCPHLHPYGRGQYAGEPVFLCIDPNIPFNPSITPITPYGDPDLCYDSCHLLNSEHNSHSNPNYMSNSNSEDNKFKEERLDCKSNSELLHKATNTSTTAATTVT